MGHRFDIWDVFTDRPFAGNQLAVIFDADDLSTEEMQTITREFNFAESSFVLRPKDPEHTAHVRIFTPEYEMPFAGHPTIGTSLAIAADRALSGPFLLELKAGLFPIDIDTSAGRAVFTNPNLPHIIEGAPPTQAIEAALGLRSGAIVGDAHCPRRVNAGVTFLYVKAPLDDVIRARVNAAAFAELKLGDTIGILLYAEGSEKAADYHVRMFAPEAGVLEDAATGSAAAALPGQLLAAGALGEGERLIRIEQGVEMGRPSYINVTVHVKDGALSSVRVGGSAVRLASGRLA